jgi:S-(hydroxymethyl)glutathione synthase
MSEIAIHPALDKGLAPAGTDFAGGVLRCACADKPVRVKADAQVAHNHACGCTKCWKPEGALFSVVGVVPTDTVTVLENGDKLKVVDPSALIQRHACTECGVHLYGPVTRNGHAFEGLSFIHAERFETTGAAPPTFAAFVSSIIESGTPPAKMGAVRARLEAIGLPHYDCLNPALMDYLATVAAKAAGTYREA